MRSWPMNVPASSRNPRADAHGMDADDLPDTVSWRDLRREAVQSLGHHLGGDRQQEARWLVERVSGYSSVELIVNEAELVSGRSVAFFDQLVARRCSGEPLQYVLGRWLFRSLELIVDPSVLIPRPETEMVAGLAIDAARVAVALKRSGQDPVTVVDLGTGSGAIALSIATEVPGTRVWATDASADALATARANLAGIGRGAARVTMSGGSWFEALPEELRGHIDVLVSNPPYVACSAAAAMPADVIGFEPHQALFAGADGTDHLAHIILLAPTWLAPGGVVVLEMSPEQTPWASDLLTRVGLVEVSVHRDFTDRPRAVVAKKPNSDP